MKNTNSALNFQLAQYRAIFSDSKVVKGLASVLVLSAGAASCYASDADASPLKTENDWNNALNHGNGTITITGGSADSGTGGKHTNLELVTSSKPYSFTLKGNQKLLIQDTAHPYTSNYIQASKPGGKFSISGGTIELERNSSGSGTASNAGLKVHAEDGGVVELIQSRLAVNSELHISTKGDTSQATVKANNITIGAGNSAENAPTAKVFVGDIQQSQNATGTGNVTFGSTSSRIVIRNDGELNVTANKSTSVLGSSITINGGRLNFEKGIDNGATTFKAYNTNINDGYVKVASGSNVTTGFGNLNINGKTNVEIGGKLNTYGTTITVDDAATLAASHDIADERGQIAVADGSTLKLSKDKLKEFLTGLKSDGSAVQYTDTSGAVHNAGKGNISLNTGKPLHGPAAVLELTDSDVLDLANTDDFKFTSDAQAGGIQADNNSAVIAKNAAVSKPIANASKLSVHAVNLKLGSADFDSSQSDLGVKELNAEHVELIPAKDRSSYTLKDQVNLATSSRGSIKGNITIDGGRIQIKQGDYALENGKDLTIIKDRQLTQADGGALAKLVPGLEINNGSLSVTGKVQTTEQGSIKIKDGSLDASNASAVKIAKASLKLDENATVIFDGRKILDIDNTNNTVSFKDDAFSADAIIKEGGSSLSTVTIKHLGTITMEQYRDLKSKTAFDGFFNGFGISNSDAKPEMSIDEVEQSTPDDIYRNTQVTVASAIDKQVSVGSVTVSNGNALEIKEQSAGGKSSSNLVKLTNAGANSNHNFVQNKDGSTADVELSGKVSQDPAPAKAPVYASLQIQGSGNIGNINGKADGNGALYVGTLDRSSSTNVSVKGDIGKQHTLGKIRVQGDASLKVDGDLVKTEQLSIDSGSDLIAPNANVTITSVGKIQGDLKAKELTIDGNSANTSVIDGGGRVEVESLIGSTQAGGAKIQIGDDKDGGQGGTLIAKNIVLNNSKLFVDPSFKSEASYAIAENLSGSSAPNNAGSVNGNVIVGKNAVFAVGFTNKDDVVSIIKNKLNSHGAFVEGSDVHNAVVLNKQITIQANDSLTIDDTADINTNNVANSNSVTFGENSALVVTDQVFDVQPDGSKSGSAINIAVSSKRVDSTKGGTVILSGRFSEADKNIKIFGGTNGSNITITNDIAVQTANGLLGGTISKNGNGSIENFKLDKERLRNMFKNTSKPVQDLAESVLGSNSTQLFDDPKAAGAQFIAHVASDSNSGVEADRALHAASFAGAQQAAIEGSNAFRNAMLERGDSINTNHQARKLKDIYTKAYYKAKAEQKGNKIEVTTPALAANTNTGVWATPTYVNTKADGYEAQGASYGADVDIKGVTVGADTLVGDATLGVAATIGTGKSDGNGQGQGLKDEFDYYGLGAYTAMSFGQFSLIGDASMTAMKHDISGASGVNGFGNLSSSVDSLAISAGITGKYIFETPYIDITPHFGTRFLRLNTDSYDLYSDGKRSNLVNTDFDAQNIFSIPVGVTLSKHYYVNGWILNPDVDLTVTVNTGDTDANSASKIYGMKDPLNLNTQIMDDVTYSAKVGFGITNGNFNSSINLNYTGSENTKSYGINANVGYDF